METPLPLAGETEPDFGELFAAALESYRSTLLAMGESGAQACPAVGPELQQSLVGLEGRLSASKLTPAGVKETGKQVNQELQLWGGRAEDYFKAKATEVKELLLLMAKAAAQVGERDKRYTSHFSQFTTQLQTIAKLEDLDQVRASLVQRTTELTTYVDTMKQDSQKLVTQLQAEVSTYEAKLKAAEDLALRDPLTGLSNRRNAEERIEARIAQKQMFCVTMIDVNRLKLVNDNHGHAAGDSLLQQFAKEMRSAARSGDVVARWGGDEFVIVMDCDLPGAQIQIERLRKWLFGEYTLQPGAGAAEVKVRVDAAIGVAAWQPGEALKQVVANADAAMYRDKEQSREEK